MKMLAHPQVMQGQTIQSQIIKGTIGKPLDATGRLIRRIRTALPPPGSTGPLIASEVLNYLTFRFRQRGFFQKLSLPATRSHLAPDDGLCRFRGSLLLGRQETTSTRTKVNGKLSRFSRRSTRQPEPPDQPRLCRQALSFERGAIFPYPPKNVNEKLAGFSAVDQPAEAV
jgi:hypothetical protein